MRGKWYRVPLDPQEKIMLDVFKDGERIKIYYNGEEIPNEIQNTPGHAFAVF